MSVAIACPSNTDAPAVPAGSGGYVTVDLAAIVENWRRIGRIVGPGCTVAAVVKADAYGLGMAPVAQALARAGCRWFFVAPVEEGLALVEALDPDLSGLRIGVLSGPSVECLVAPSLVPVINDLGQLEAWRVMAPGRPAILNLDTGMARLGMPVSEAAHLAADPALLDGVPVAAVMSHLACPDQHDHPMNERQRALFLRLAGGLPAAPRSLAASYGTFLGSSYRLDMVRTGAALYGLNPLPGRANPMLPVVGLRARILQVREVEAGDTAGYGATWTAEGKRRLATLAVGYADGLLRESANRGSVRFGPMAAPIVGRVSMDLVTVDVTSVPPAWAQPGGFADLVGPHGTIEDLARDSGTIGYELLTRLGPRLRRVYEGAT